MYKDIVRTNLSYRPRQTSSFSLASLAAHRLPEDGIKFQSVAAQFRNSGRALPAGGLQSQLEHLTDDCIVHGALARFRDYGLMGFIN